ncbi:AraC family transcriptional regulator [Pricia sp. S334]|uniref:AraC family transcriptional regulator n=1 Tax=Pricia mediterranea TaxID=3076079 RepID=A0ABU3L9M7_9FLAO|nr:AraC family transcriptional regulator [Pricia sp. S334]MDT7830444.1 AraC family transcriptional regulator [Pricia sp. S334]
MKNFGQLGSMETEHTTPRISLTLGKITESHFNQGKRLKQCDASGTYDLKTKIDSNGIQIVFKEILFDFFKVAVGTFNATKTVQLDYTFIGETVQMVFLPKGNATMFTLDRKYHFKSNECNIFFGTDAEGTLILEKGENSFFLVDIQKDFFIKNFPRYKNFEDFRKQIQNDQAGFVRNENMSITPEMLLLINAVRHCRCNDHFRKIHMHAKVMELLLVQLDLFKVNVERTEQVSPCNMTKMQIARNYLSENFRDPMTLSELSKKIGTNEFLLKRDFKSLFGTTVFGYVADIRMKKAKTLLLQGEFSIGQISDEVGYKNPQHFSTAFKRKFGMPPSAIKSSHKN